MDFADLAEVKTYWGCCGRWPWMECRPCGDARSADDELHGCVQFICCMHKSEVD